MDVPTIHAEAKRRYWNGKDLAAARRLLDEGIARARAQGDCDAEKPLQYDLASFCWPGRDEPEIVIGDEEVRAGEEAANENLRLANEFQRGDRALASAWFMVGAYHVAQHRLKKAEQAFDEHGRSAERAGDRGLVLLAVGYGQLARALSSQPEDVISIIGGYGDFLRSQEGVEHAREFADQLQTSARVFGGR